MSFNNLYPSHSRRPFKNTKYVFETMIRKAKSNCRHGDFQTKLLKIKKCCDYEQLILFQFFNLLLVSFGTIWKYLTLTGTIWAQSHCLETFSSYSAIIQFEFFFHYQSPQPHGVWFSIRKIYIDKYL